MTMIPAYGANGNLFLVSASEDGSLCLYGALATNC
jgi:hypothetical protein